MAPTPFPWRPWKSLLPYYLVLLIRDSNSLVNILNVALHSKQIKWQHQMTASFSRWMTSIPDQRVIGFGLRWRSPPGFCIFTMLVHPNSAFCSIYLENANWGSVSNLTGTLSCFILLIVFEKCSWKPIFQCFEIFKKIRKLN